MAGHSMRKFLLGAALLLTVSPIVFAADSLDALADDVDRLESLRQVKDVQRTYAHLAQLGQWNSMAALFARDAQFIHGSDSVRGSDAIGKWLTRKGGGSQGLGPAAVHFEFIDEPLA